MSSAHVTTPLPAPGGMLSVAENHLRELNPSATLKVFGQELNPESYAICKSDMLIKGEDAAHIKFGNSFTQDGLPGETFDYFLSNPPFGVEWKKVEKEIRDEHEKMGMAGRFGAGLPRVSDGSLLFLQHMVSKFRQDGTGSRLAIVFNGSPLFTGSAGSGESEIRRWIIENDWLEAIVGLPDQLFYNTGIATYVWVVTNRKPRKPQGQGSTDRRHQLLREDAEEPGQQAERDRRRHQRQARPDRRDHPHLRRLRGGRVSQDLRQRGLRLLADHGRAPAAAELRRRRPSG